MTQIVLNLIYSSIKLWVNCKTKLKEDLHRVELDLCEYVEEFIYSH